jgi:hypothetical protein
MFPSAVSTWIGQAEEVQPRACSKPNKFLYGTTLGKQETDAVAEAGGAGAGEPHHVGVEVERVHVPDLEPLQQDLHADAPPAAHLQHGGAGERAPEGQEPASLVATLDRGPDGVVHEGLLDGVEDHGASTGDMPGTSG